MGASADKPNDFETATNPADTPNAPDSEPPPIEEALPALRTPTEQRFYNRHLYAEIAWYGVLAGSTLSFVVIYITRLGATPAQLGWINAGPALVALLATLPIGRWLSKQHIGGAITWTAVVHRLAFGLFAVFPFVLPPSAQIWAYIALTLVMAVPGTILSVGFNSLYAAAVPPEQRGHVAGIRNALVALTLVISSLVSGFILDRFPQTQGYAVVFVIGFVGGLVGLYHLAMLRTLRGDEGIDKSKVRSTMGDNFRGSGAVLSTGAMRPGIALRIFARGRVILRPEIMRTSFGLLVIALALFHFAQFIPAPIFPIFLVDGLKLSDQQISLGTALFQFCVFLGSFQIGYLTRRKGNLWITVIGIFFLSLYPLAMALASSMTHYLIASVLGGLAWALVGGALANYVLEVAPEDDRPAHLAWYNIALSLGVLVGSLAGPLLSDAFGLRWALFIAFALRALSACAVWWAGLRARKSITS